MRRYAQRDYSQVTIGNATAAPPDDRRRAAPKATPALEADSDGEYDMNPDRARRGSGGDAPKKQRWPWQSRPAPRPSEQMRSHERRRSSNRAAAPVDSDDDDVERLGTNPQHFRNVDAAAETEYRRRRPGAVEQRRCCTSSAPGETRALTARRERLRAHARARAPPRASVRARPPRDDDNY